MSLDTPGAGPSRRHAQSIDLEAEDLAFFLRKSRDYTELEASVQSSTELLSSLASYLSTFQNDLSAVSGQIADLQQLSAGIESQLNGRKTVIPSLQSLLADITLSPALVLTLRDTTPAESPHLWLGAISQLEEKIATVKARSKVKAAGEMEKLIEGFRIKALGQLPPFLLALIGPLRSASKGLSTNLAVLQTSLLLKYQPFYAFLNRQSPKIAQQVERGYVNAARAYYETGMRRYARALGTIRTRSVERVNLLGSPEPLDKMTYERLRYAELDGDVVLAYMADDRDLQLPPEALFRSLGLVLVDNASAEFTFIVRFFGPDLKTAERIWHEVFDSALEYASSFFRSMQSPAPPAIPLLTLIRINDRFLATCESRGTIPLEPLLQGQKLILWPLYKKDMDRHYESVKALADEAGAKGLSGFMGRGVKDATVRSVITKYAGLFSCVVALSDEAEEAMLFSSTTRIRNEVVRLVSTQANKKAAADRNSFISSMFELLLHELVAGPGSITHPRLQTELSYFKSREEEARRRVA